MQILRRLFRTWWSVALKLVGRGPRRGRTRPLDASAVPYDIDSVNGMRKVRPNGHLPIYLLLSEGAEGKRKRRRLGLDEDQDEEQDDEMSKLAIQLDLERQWRLHGSDDKDKWTDN